ncbi:EF-hand calcium-binding domain-containing protein 1 isoform X1 [Folsomia candida]|uniref:EF-hand calcium-binding domain-containing protein 1 isoform X1 n=1 Tax=Folsomia candida TaxID=158441 RepID=UPI000B9099AA|nr:EF-hand calcium-binding domain-containing protein 1 isoform X1 [Folsomia candida]XP_035706450.1 EF-hand calcium-binding domain-containing protein 1 isoform X1 [Folsomia candida]
MSERIGKQKNTLEVAQKLSTKTRFSTDECRSLLTIHQRIAALGKVDRLRFREVLHTAFDITDDVMLDRVYRVFDKDNDGIISDHEWVEGVSLLCRGTPDQLIDFCYMVYDINGDKSLAREELSHCLKGGLVPYAGVMNGDEIEEAMREIVEIGMKKLDRDKDGQITQPDFTNACYYDPLLLQSIGPCLPPARSLAAFMAIFTENYRSYSTEWNDEWKEQQRRVELGENPLQIDRTFSKDKTSTSSVLVVGRSGAKSKPQKSKGRKKSMSKNYK